MEIFIEILLELFFEIFGGGIEAAMESPKTPLKAKIFILSVLCAILVCVFLTVGVLLYINDKHLPVLLLFAGISLLFVIFWIFGVIRLCKKNKK